MEMMSRCIQLDMECATMCYAAAQLMSLGSEKALDACPCVLSFATDVQKNAASTKMSIVANVHEFAANVRRNAKVCR
jgi:hypothetical protein